jgi:HD-GYP domain-containing protein (c-di-GMP phosphodiesterase class II)
MTAPSAYYDLIRYLVAAMNGRRIYPPRHPVLDRTLARVEQSLLSLMVSRDEVQLGVFGNHLLADDLPWEEQGESHSALSRELKARGIDKLTFQRGFRRADLESLVEVLCGDRASGDHKSVGGATSVADLLAGRGVSRIRVGHLDLERKKEAPETPETSGGRGAYQEAVGGLQETMEGIQAGRVVRIKQIHNLVDLLVEHLSRGPGPLLMLTALKGHSDYTFSHIVNVSILALAQIQAISSDAEAIREYGIAAMLHDMGKMRVPKEILEKRGKLTDDEFEVIRRHPLETLHILRETPGVSDLALVVGFEHHRRYDQSGYPKVKHPLPQHFATRICTLADAYDAMRSNRSYQRELPPEGAMEIVQTQSGKMFDPVLVRLFIRMMGAYPPGTRIRLDTAEEAMVLKANPADPFRPIVRILGDHPAGEGDPLRLVNLAERDPKTGAYLRSAVNSVRDHPPAS